MYIWIKLEDSTPRGNSETELNATGECFAYALKGARSCEFGRIQRIMHKPVFVSRSRAKKIVEDAQTCIIGLR